MNYMPIRQQTSSNRRMKKSTETYTGRRTHKKQKKESRWLSGSSVHFRIKMSRFTLLEYGAESQVNKWLSTNAFMTGIQYRPLASYAAANCFLGQLKEWNMFATSDTHLRWMSVVWSSSPSLRMVGVVSLKKIWLGKYLESKKCGLLGHILTCAKYLIPYLFQLLNISI